MSKGRRIMTVLGIIVAILGTGILTIRIFFVSRENQAIRVAQEYLTQKYDKEIEYVDIYYQSWFYPRFYRVRFISASRPEVIFTVSVQDNLEIPDELWKFGQSSQSADNYYIRCFEYYMDEYLLGDIMSLWGNDATVKVLDIANIDGAVFSISPQLCNEMSLDEMEHLINGYRIYVRTNGELSEKLLEANANQIIEFFQIIKDNGFRPTTISFNFSNVETDAQSIVFDNWSEVVSVNQVIAQLRQEMEGN